MSGRPGDPPRFSYLGPAGTFTHAALRQVAGDACEVPAHDVPSALEMVRRGEADYAVVPIEKVASFPLWKELSNTAPVRPLTPT